MKRIWGSLPFLLWAALAAAQVQPGEPLFVAPSVPYVPEAALPAPLLVPSAEPVDPYLPVLEKAAALNGVDVPLVRQALNRFETRAGVRVTSIGMTPAQLERQLSKDEFRSRYIEAALLSRAKPELSAYSDAIVSAARDFGVTTEDAESLARAKGLVGLNFSSAAFERQLRRELERSEMEKLTAEWPNNAQARFMKGLISNIRAKSGKSVEEIARAGAFAYFRLSGAFVASAESGRDPDVQTDAIFYVTYERGRFKFALYSQGRFVSNPDASIRRWLSTGLPALQLD